MQVAATSPCFETQSDTADDFLASELHRPGSQASIKPGGRKKALLAGCSYKNAAYALNGCTNDARCLRHLLLTRFGFQDRDITLLTDDQQDPQKWPTRANLLHNMQVLVASQQPGDSLFFSFSGHAKRRRRCFIPRVGVQQVAAPCTLVADQDTSKTDEPQTMDQIRVPTSSAGLNYQAFQNAHHSHNLRMQLAICPCDYKTAGEIITRELNQILVNSILPGVSLHCIIDACHSGSLLGLDHCAEFQPGYGTRWKQQDDRSSNTGTRGGLCIQIGAAGDKQTAADTNQLHGQVSTGAATFSFIQAFEENAAGLSYSQLLEAMHDSIASLCKGSSVGNGGSLGEKLKHALGGFQSRKQTPCLSSASLFDLNDKISI